MSSIAVMSLARSKSAATSWTTNREVDAGDQEHEHLAYRQNGEHRRLGGDVGEVLYRHEHGAEEIEHQDDAGTEPYEQEGPPERPLRVHDRPRTGNSSIVEGAHAIPWLLRRGPTGCQGRSAIMNEASSGRPFHSPRAANPGNPQVAPPSSTPPWLVPIPLARMLLTLDTRVNSQGFITGIRISRAKSAFQEPWCDVRCCGWKYRFVGASTL